MTGAGAGPRGPGSPRGTALADRLYASERASLLRYLSGVVGDVHHGEELVQEVMLRAFLHADRLRDNQDEVRAWLFRVARNIAIDELRRRRARPVPAPLDDPDHTAGTGPDPTERLLTHITLRQALARLTEEHRSVLVEVFFRGATTAEAAQALHIPHGTVKSRLYYGLRRLRACLTDLP